MPNELIVRNGFTSQGNSFINGTLSVTGNTTLQTINVTTLGITGTTTTRSIIPESNNTYNLGATNRRWSGVYTREIRFYDADGTSVNDYITVSAPTDLASSPKPAWALTLPLLSGSTNSFLGVYSGASNTSNTTWFSLSGGTGISISQTSNASGGTMTLSSSPTSFYSEPSSTAVTWNVSGNSTNYKLTLTANTTLNLSNVRNGDYGTIILTQDSGGNRTVTLGTVNGGSATHKVVNGGAGLVSLTATANAIDILSFTFDGTNIYWNKGLNYT